MAFNPILSFKLLVSSFEFDRGDASPRDKDRIKGLKGYGLTSPFLGAKGRLGPAWRDGGGDVSPGNSESKKYLRE
jgi:hypothetical protein